MFWGAVFGTVPDLDVIGNFFLSETASLIFHRGPSHSLLFSLAMAPLFGLLLARLYKKRHPDWKPWAWIAFAALVTHPILDAFTTYGTQFFWPFSDWAIAWNTIAVVDPLYTLPLLITLIMAAFLKRDSKRRARIARAGVIFSTLYLSFTVWNRSQVSKDLEKAFADYEIPVTRMYLKPALMTNLLWGVAGETKHAYWVADYSRLDWGHPLFRCIPKNHHLLKPYEGQENVDRLLWFSDGFYSLEETANGLKYRDMRFGTTRGWDDRSGHYIFSFDLEPLGDHPSDGIKVKKDLGVAQETDFPGVMKMIWKRQFGILQKGRIDGSDCGL